MIRPRTVLVVAILLSMSACLPPRRVERKLTTMEQAATLDRRSEFLKAHMRDGALLVLRNWRFSDDGRTLNGSGLRLGINRDTLANGSLDVPLDSVLLFETNVLTSPKPSTALTVMTVLTAGMGLFCAANPKTCFGSCPTFYAGSDTRILAEGFSSSIAPPLEATDVDRLEIAPVTRPTFELRMTNEALETHVVRSLRLLAFAVRPGTQVFAAGKEFWRTGEPIAPMCRAREGDCTAQIAAVDHNERFSLADSMDLGTREDIELEFVVAAGDYGLLLTSRQSLLHTYVLYQTLAFMGNHAGHWLASLGRGDRTVMRGVYDLGRALGGIEIGRPNGRDGDFIASVHETGPLALDTHLIPLGTLSAGAHKIRLRMGQGHWRLDRVAIAPMLERVEPIPVPPSEVRKNSARDAGALRALTSRGETLNTLPGDEYRITFRLPRSSAGLELFLESRGYYLEWLRTEWLAEENAERARMMLFEPSRGLREIARDFKQWEPRMEELFWRSRYARP